LADEEIQKEIYAELPFGGALSDSYLFHSAIRSSITLYLQLLDGTVSDPVPTKWSRSEQLEKLGATISRYIYELESFGNSEEVIMDIGSEDETEALMARYLNADPRDESLWEEGRIKSYELLRGRMFSGAGNEKDEQAICDTLWRIFHLRMISEKCADFSPEERYTALMLNQVMNSLAQALDQVNWED
jgi:hypothetical protein